MKTVIWVVCVLVASGVVAFAKMNRVTLGAIPMALLYGATVFIANLLCRKWDESHPRQK